MRNNSIIKIIIGLSFLFCLNVTQAQSKAKSGSKLKDTFISRGTHRYIGYFEMIGKSYYLVLNKNTSSPFKILIDLGKRNGLKSFLNNTVDFNLKFIESCQKSMSCKATLLKYYGIHQAYKKVPTYILKENLR